MNPSSPSELQAASGDRGFRSFRQWVMAGPHPNTPTPTMDLCTCPGSNAMPIPMVLIGDEREQGKLAVSFADGRAVFSTARFPGDPNEHPIMVRPEDRKALGHMLLRDDL